MSEERTFLQCKCGGIACSCWSLWGLNTDNEIKMHYFKCLRCQNEQLPFESIDDAICDWNSKNKGK